MPRMPRVMRLQVASPTVSRVPPSTAPFLDAVAGEGDQVEGHCVPVRTQGRVVLYPHQGGSYQIGPIAS